MKIYTKSGDTGETGLLGGLRVRKSHPAIHICGGLDELNSLLGLSISYSPAGGVKQLLTQIQNDIFDLGSRIAACESSSARAAEFPASRSQSLEAWIDHYQAQLPELRQFILPGGAACGATLHLSRAVCRRVERDLVAYVDSGTICELTIELIYLNRLSDLLFVLARFVNHLQGIEETAWRVSR